MQNCKHNVNVSYVLNCCISLLIWNAIGRPTLCVVSGHFVFFYIFLCLVNMFSIILCTMSNKILPYHTIPSYICNAYNKTMTYTNNIVILYKLSNVIK